MFVDAIFPGGAVMIDLAALDVVVGCSAATIIIAITVAITVVIVAIWIEVVIVVRPDTWNRIAVALFDVLWLTAGRTDTFATFTDGIFVRDVALGTKIDASCKRAVTQYFAVDQA